MIYTGFYIISALFVINKLSTFSKINLGIIMGLMIPDLDIFFKYLIFNNDFHGGIFYSIIFSTLLFIFSFESIVEFIITAKLEELLLYFLLYDD